MSDIALSSAHDESSNVTPPWRSIYRTDLFRGKVALVTGGGTGIGYAITEELATLGATVVIASRNSERCAEAAHRINSYLPADCAGKAVACPTSMNLKSEESVAAAVSYVVGTFGGLHLLVNNAGGQFVVSAEDLSRNGFGAVVDTNLLGTFLLCREAYNQYMRDSPEVCSVVNITLGNRNGMPGMVHSGAARAGVENMAKTMSMEWMDSNVRVNCVRPGIIFTESGFENYGEAGPTFVGRVLPSIPAKRFGTAQEVSSAAVWLLSDGAAYVTGSVVVVDGGQGFTLLPLVDIDEGQAHMVPEYGGPLKTGLSKL